MDTGSWLKACKVAFLYIILVTFSATSPAIEQANAELELSAIAEFSAINLAQDAWRAVIPVPGIDEQYFLATQNGNVYSLTNKQVSHTPLLNIQNRLENAEVIALTSIALDPSFNFRDRTGFNTFYTAHVEVRDTEKKLNTPTDTSAHHAESVPAALPFDAVIMRWQLHKQINQPAKVIAQHEVIRIPIHHQNEAFKQLHFHPFTESWHEDFGLLYALLAKTKNTLKTQQAIYSGAILRIKPEKFGLQSYTIPANNPFTRQADIRNEIVFMAGDNITNFDWIKKGKHTLMVQLKNQQELQFFLAKPGDDWRQGLPNKPLQTTGANTQGNNSAIFYHGRILKSLWGKILQLHFVNNSWQLKALAVNTATPTETIPSQHTHKLHYSEQAPNFSLHKNNNNELLLLEHSQQLLYAVTLTKASAEKTVQKNLAVTDENSSNSGVVIFIIIVLILMGYLIYSRLVPTKKQHFLYQQWANFDVNAATQSLSLYKRHSKTVEQIVKISSLNKSEILLNDNAISVVTADTEQGFSNAIEEQVLTSFAKEHRLKMIDGKQRKIQLRLTDENNTIYLFCLYYRVGNTRHTKLKYSKVLNKIIDWNWLFSQYINPNNTDKRKIRVKPETDTVNTDTANSANKMNALNQQQSSHLQSKKNHENNGEIANRLPEENSTKSNDANQDTELVSALNKLVEMKKQGYLNEEEFNNAKAKILKDLAKD